MAVTLDEGFEPYNTWVSLANQKYNEAMAIYLILQHYIIQGAGYTFQVKPMCWGLMPCHVLYILPVFTYRGVPVSLSFLPSRIPLSISCLGWPSSQGRKVVEAPVCLPFIFCLLHVRTSTPSIAFSPLEDPQ